MARGGRRVGAGRAKGTPNKRTVLKLQEAGKVIADARRSPDVVRAKNVLADLTKTAMGFAAHYQKKMMDFEAEPANTGKLPPKEVVDRFLDGLNTAIRAAKALAPFQDPTFTAIRASISPLDVPLDAGDSAKVVKGKEIDIKDPVELARMYAQLVRAA